MDGPLRPAIFIDRPNRFIVHVDLNGKRMTCHLPDPGRLQELLLPGAEVWIRENKNPNRKTSASAVLVKAGTPKRKDGPFVCLISALPNRFVKELLEAGKLPGFEKRKLIRPEIPFGDHRFDFLLNEPDGSPFYLEVKSVTFVENGIARFPDAVTKRGKNHAMTLATIRKSGSGAGIIFICQRPDAREFRPMWDRDPKLAKALVNAKEVGVEIRCFTCTVDPKSMQLSREIPVNLRPE